jgi:hypothetical protein
VNQPQLKVNHDELIRDYAGYEFIQDEMEALLKQFLQLYYQDILKLYDVPEPQNTQTVEIIAAGAGASKFVFGAIDKQANLTLGIRLYNSKGFMKDGDKTYNSADEYKVNLETHDKELAEALIDETRIYEELEKNAAKTGIDIRGTWSRFPLQKNNYKNTEYAQYIEDFIYIEDRELKRLMVNLGINAFTIGGFIIGYDGKKILERPEFGPQDKLNAIIHISNTLLQSWLFTVRYNHKLVGRTIVDLKPAQFVIQADETKTEDIMPAIVIDIGPAENTDNIYTYLKDVSYMKKLIPAFATEMLRKLGLSEQDYQTAKQSVYEQIINYLTQCKQSTTKPKMIQPNEFEQLVDEFITAMKAKLP